MKILLSTFFHNKCSFSVFYNHFFKWLISHFPEDKTEVVFLLTSFIYEESKNYDLPDFCKKVLISDDEFVNVFGEELSRKFLENHFSQGLNDNQIVKLRNFMYKKCKNWEPDVIITHGGCSAKKIWGKVFEKALCLTNENAIFSRPPFLRTLSYDPYEPIPNNFMVHYSEDIKKLKITKKQNRDVEEFKHKITKLIDKNNLIKDDILKYKRKFKKLVLLPLVGNEFISLYKDYYYDSELEIVEKILKRIPSNIGLCVTVHDSYLSLTDEDIEYLSAKYQNFIFLQKTNVKGYASNSLHYFKYIDAVFNTSSKTALTGLLWDRPVLSLTKISNKYIEDGNGIEDIEKVLKLKSVQKNSFIYWYFTHYCLFEPDMVTPGFMYDYLDKKLSYYKKHGINYGYFDEINDFKRVTNQVIDSVKEYYRKTYENKLITKLNRVKRFIQFCKIISN